MEYLFGSAADELRRIRELQAFHHRALAELGPRATELARIIHADEGFTEDRIQIDVAVTDTVATGPVIDLTSMEVPSRVRPAEEQIRIPASFHF